MATPKNRLALCYDAVMTRTKSELLKRILKRRSFAGLMDLYEINYRLLQRLAPALDEIPERAVSRVPGSPDLYLAIEERCRFTTMLHLTYYFTDADGERVADPDLQIRLYHDARQAEAVACRPHPASGPRSPLSCKWDSNLFLEKWLHYALGLGHRFDRASALTAAPLAVRVPLTAS